MKPKLDAIAEIVERILTLRQSGAEGAIETGELLIKAKKLVGHGNWLQWLRDNFQWSEDTAERFMRLKEVYGTANSALLRKMDLSALYLLSQPSTPKAARKEVEKLINKGTAPSISDVREIISDAKPKPKPAKAPLPSAEPDEPQPIPPPGELDAPALAPQPASESDDELTSAEQGMLDKFDAAIKSLKFLYTKNPVMFKGRHDKRDLEQIAAFIVQVAS